MNIASILSNLGRVRPQPPRPMDEVPRPDSPPDRTMVDRIPSYAQPQPADAASARVASSVGIPTTPTITPRTAFDSSMARVQGTPAPDPFTTRVSPSLVAAAPTSGQVDGHVAQERVPSYEDIPMPPKAPELADVKPSTPMPTREMHHGGIGSRFKDAAKFGLRSLLLSGGNPLYALGAGVGALVNPQAEHDQKYNREMATWEPRAQAEMDVIKKHNEGLIQQGNAQNQYYDNAAKREDQIDKRQGRVERHQDRMTAAGERVATRQDAESQRKHQQAKDHVTFNAAHGLPNDPAIVKGTVYESLGGKTITPDKVPHFEAGGRKMWDAKLGRFVDAPGSEDLPPLRDPNDFTPEQEYQHQENARKEAELRQEKGSGAYKAFTEAQREAQKAADLYGKSVIEMQRQRADPSVKGQEDAGMLKTGEKAITQEDLNKLKADHDAAVRKMNDAHAALGDYSDLYESGVTEGKTKKLDRTPAGRQRTIEVPTGEKYPWAKPRAEGPKGRGSTVPKGSTAGQKVRPGGGLLD